MFAILFLYLIVKKKSIYMRIGILLGIVPRHENNRGFMKRALYKFKNKS